MQRSLARRRRSVESAIRPVPGQSTLAGFPSCSSERRASRRLGTTPQRRSERSDSVRCRTRTHCVICPRGSYIRITRAGRFFHAHESIDQSVTPTARTGAPSPRAPADTPASEQREIEDPSGSVAQYERPEKSSEFIPKSTARERTRK
jgi:hypothetical protein